MKIVMLPTLMRQRQRAVDTFLKKINETLRKHVPVAAQGPLIVNALSTAFQFQMSMWWMVGDECIRPLQVKHSDWCGMASVVQTIVETFPNNCTIMFPQALSSADSFSATFRPVSSEEEDNDEPINRGICRFELSTPCRGITRIHRSPSRPRPAVRPTAAFINIHEHPL